jgi:UDP-glucose 4-epimerase
METKKFVLCTGGLGYVGSHTVISLYEKGYKAVILDNLTNSNVKCLSQLESIIKEKLVFYQEDLKNLEAIDKVFKTQKDKGEPICAVIHFAALKAVKDSVNNPLAYYENNLGSTINLLKAMEKAGCKYLIFSGSACVYGDNASAKEEDPLGPINPYGQTKVMVEQIMKDYAVANKSFRGVSLRYFNPIGAHNSGLIGEDPKGKPNNLMPIIQKVAIGEIPVLKVYGNDYKTRDGTCIRDYIHVQDIADAHANALKYIEEMKEGFDVINLGSGKGTTVLELIAAFEKANGIVLNKEIVGRREGDAPIITAVTDKALKLLGWKVKRSIEECCKDSWKWISTHSKGYES